MSLSLAALRELVSFGLTAEQILRVAEAQGDAVAAAPSRSVGAERQARYRARQAESVTDDVTCDVTRDAAEAAPSFSPRPPKPTLSPPSFTPLKGGVSFPQTDFDAWWAIYPRKVGKAKAVKAYPAAHRQAGADMLLGATALAIQSAQWRKGIIPNPATWLNERRWEDELPALDPPASRRVAFV